MSLGVKSIALVLLLAAPSAAKTAPRRRAATDGGPTVSAPHVNGVQREQLLDLPAGPAGADERVRALPGQLGLEIELAVSPGEVAQALDAIPTPWHVGAQAIDGGVRIRIVHPNGGVVFATGRTASTMRVAFGAADEQTRLRAFAGSVRQPLPEPDDLGAELEVWQDAERAMAAGELPDAKRLWQRLVEVPRLADLAALRIAELYVASGHINEALAQLREVASRHPRSTGAVLARLDILHLEVLTGAATPSVAQIDIAANIIDRAEFDGFSGVRAAMVLRDLGLHHAALARLPDPTALPTTLLSATEALRQDLVALTLVGPVLRGDPRGTAIQWDIWSTQLGVLAEHDAITDLVAEAHEQLGLFETALPLLQARLRVQPSPRTEADLVGRVAHIYRMLGDVERASFSVEFQLTAHPDAPGLLPEIAALAVTRCDRDGLAAARSWLADARKRATSASTSLAIDALEDELVLGWGTSAQIVHTLSSASDTSLANNSATSASMQPTSKDPVTAARHAHALAVALVRVGRHAQAADLLRSLAGRTADPAERDRLAYHLAVAEQGLGHDADAHKILVHISTHGTRFGQLAVARLQEQRLAAAAKRLSEVGTP